MKKQFNKEAVMHDIAEGCIRLGFYGATVLLGTLALNKIKNDELEANSKLRNSEYENNKFKLRDLRNKIEEIKK